MPKKGNPADYNSSIFSPRLPPIRPKLFKENRLQLFEIIKDAEKGRKMVEAIFSQVIHTFAIFQVCHFTVRIFYTVHYFFWLMLKNFCMFNLFGIYLYIHICNCGHL